MPKNPLFMLVLVFVLGYLIGVKMPGPGSTALATVGL